MFQGNSNIPDKEKSESCLEYSFMNDPNGAITEYVLTLQNGELTMADDERKPNGCKSYIGNEDDDMISLMSFEESDSDFDIISLTDSADSSTATEIDRENDIDIANEVMKILRLNNEYVG